MNLLLDTPIALWWLGDTPELPDAVREVVQNSDNVVYVSAATIWEIAIKRALGKLEIGDEYVSEIAAQGSWAHAGHDRRDDPQVLGERPASPGLNMDGPGCTVPFRSVYWPTGRARRSSRGWATPNA